MKKWKALSGVIISLLMYTSVFAAQPSVPNPKLQQGKPSTSAPVSSNIKPALAQNFASSNDLAVFNSNLDKLRNLQNNARALSKEFVVEYTAVIDKKIDELAQIISEKIVRNLDKYKSTPGEAYPKVYPFAPNIQPINGQQMVDTPFGKIEMTVKMKNALTKLEPVEASLDEISGSMMKNILSVPPLNRAQFLAAQMDINLRRNFRSLHTAVFGLTNDPSCVGDIVLDGYVGKYWERFLNADYVMAYGYLHAIANQLTCISAYQGKQLDIFLKNAKDSAINAYAGLLAGTAVGKINLLKDESIAYLNAALYNLALLIYDFNKPTFSVWQAWFCENLPGNIELYKPGKPLYTFGIWLYDSVNSALTSVLFDTKNEGQAAYQCAAIDKVIEDKDLSLYGDDIEMLAKECANVGTGPKQGQLVSFGKFNNFVANPKMGAQDFLQAAAKGQPDLAGICGGGGGGGGGGGSMGCSTMGGGGSAYSCESSAKGSLIGNAAAASGPDGSAGGKVPVLVEVKKLRVSKLCSQQGDPAPDANPGAGGSGGGSGSAMGDLFGGGGIKEKGVGEFKTQSEKNMDAQKAAGKDALNAGKDKIVNEIKEHTGLEMNADQQNTFFEAAEGAIDGMQAGGGTTCGQGGCESKGYTDSSGNIYMPGNLMKDPVLVAHEGIHAGLKALGVGFNKTSDVPKPKGGGMARVQHIITGDSGFGYSNYYPSPEATTDMYSCTLGAMGSPLMSGGCSSMSDQEFKDWCSSPIANCMNPMASGGGTPSGYGGANAKEGSSLMGAAGGPAGPDCGGPEAGGGCGGFNLGGCGGGGGSPVGMMIKKGDGISDPSPIDSTNTLSNWMTNKYNSTLKNKMQGK